MKIAFVWFGISGRYGIWRDGLWRAMKHIEQEHEVKYFEPSDDIESFNPDVILFWEALCTSQSKDKAMWDRVVNLPFKKCLLFAGGPIRAEWATPFDHIFVEGEFNKKEFDALGIKNSIAFGINEEIMRPINTVKVYDGMHHGTCASWKRQWLLAEALGNKGLVVGRFQDSDPYPFTRSKELGCNIMDEKTPEEICLLLNQSHCVVQTSEYWGGGQRCTLEAMACNIPVICMSDSPKNREYVEESGFGIVVDPSVQQIQKSVNDIKINRVMSSRLSGGRDYIMSKWTSKHYADAIIKGINSI